MANHPNRNRWIDADYDTQIGQIGFLVEREHNLQGWTRWSLQGSPACTNMSHRPVFHGWCGTTNDVAAYARGMAQVVKFSANGQRAYVRSLSGDELSAALEGAGYPFELA